MEDTRSTGLVTWSKSEMESSVPEETSTLSQREVCQNANKRVTSGCEPQNWPIHWVPILALASKS